MSFLNFEFLKGYIKKAKKWNHPIMALLSYYVIIYVTLGISFDELSVSLDCCIIELWHPMKRNYVFKKKLN